MPRSILVTEGSSALGAALARLLSAHGYAVAAACDRAGGEGAASGDLLSFPWNRRSAASAHTILLSALNAFGALDEAIILEPPFTAAAALVSASSAEVDRAFDDAKGPVLITREVVTAFLGRGAGIVSFVSGGPAAGPVEAAVREAFRGLATALLSSPGGPGIVANGFQGGGADPGEFAAFIDRTLEEKARKISGRWFSLPGRGGFFQGVFKTSSNP